MGVQPLFGDKQLKVVAYCAEEVRRQMDTPLHVGYMIEAWELAWAKTVMYPSPITVELVEAIGLNVEPNENRYGFRHVDVRVGFDVKMRWQDVPRAMVNLCEAWTERRIDGFNHPEAGEVGPAERFYFEFEQIHPFRDGNGRTGKVLYNAIKGTLDAPVWPPNFWGSSNP